MYKVIKRMEISSSHRIFLSKNKCENLHGHNYIITVYLKSQNLNEYGMVEDFTYIKKLIYDKLDHKNLNDLIDQPTCENIAKYVTDLIGQKCYRTIVQESENNISIYER